MDEETASQTPECEGAEKDAKWILDCVRQAEHHTILCIDGAEGCAEPHWWWVDELAPGSGTAPPLTSEDSL